MIRLSNTQAVILSAASQRDDGAVLPLPEALKIRGGAVDKVLGSLKAKGLIEHRGSRRGGNPPPLRITRAGLEAIRVEPEDEGESAADVPAPVAKADGATPAKKSKPGKGKAMASNAAPAQKPTPGAGTKQARMIELLKRPEGATAEQIAAATGWQHHTIRGAISGALRKKLGLTVVTTRTREAGPNKTGAKGSSTVYRILDPGTSAPQAG
jgi:predicted ArsR family transcriptional regulator